MKIKQFLVTISVVLAVFTLLTVSTAFAGKPPPPSHLGVTPDNFVTLRSYMSDSTINFERVFPDGNTSGQTTPYTPTGGTLIITDVECIFGEPFGGALLLQVNGEQVYGSSGGGGEKFSDHLTAGIVVPEGGTISAPAPPGSAFLRGYLVPSQ